MGFPENGVSAVLHFRTGYRMRSYTKRWITGNLFKGITGFSSKKINIVLKGEFWARGSNSVFLIQTLRFRPVFEVFRIGRNLSAFR
jgi:hypothetical protein